MSAKTTSLEEELRQLPGVDPAWNLDEILADVGVRLANHGELLQRIERAMAVLSLPPDLVAGTEPNRASAKAMRQEATEAFRTGP